MDVLGRTVLEPDVLVAAVRSDRGASRVLLTAALDRRYAVLASVPLMLQYESVLTRYPTIYNREWLKPRRYFGAAEAQKESCGPARAVGKSGERGSRAEVRNYEPQVLRLRSASCSRRVRF